MKTFKNIVSGFIKTLNENEQVVEEPAKQEVPAEETVELTQAEKQIHIFVDKARTETELLIFKKADGDISIYTSDEDMEDFAVGTQDQLEEYFAKMFDDETIEAIENLFHEDLRQGAAKGFFDAEVMKLSDKIISTEGIQGLKILFNPHYYEVVGSDTEFAVQLKRA